MELLNFVLFFVLRRPLFQLFFACFCFLSEGIILIEKKIVDLRTLKLSRDPQRPATALWGISPSLQRPLNRLFQCS